MEHNNDSRNRNNDGRNFRQSDENNNWNQSSDFQGNRNATSDRYENQSDRNSRTSGRDQSSDGRYDWNTNQENRDNSNRFRSDGQGSRLQSMGSLGNDTGRYNEGDDTRDSWGRSGSRQSGGSWNEGNQGNYNTGRSTNYDYDNRGGQFSFDRDRKNDNSSYRDGNEGRNWWDKAKDEVSGWFGDDGAQQRKNSGQSGEHRGKGPKGYTRTDERIKEDVHERLTEDSMIDAGNIEVDVKQGEVYLKGSVNSRNEKRRAEDIIENISGVNNVENHIRVKTGNQSPDNLGQNSGQFGEKKFGSSTGSGVNVGVGNTHN